MGGKGIRKDGRDGIRGFEMGWDERGGGMRMVSGNQRLD